MVAICCCQCDPRLATYAIAAISFLHYGVETILLLTLDEDHRLVAEDDGIKFYTVLLSHLYLVFASVALFFAAYKLRVPLCFPWLIGCTFVLLLYLAVLVLVFLRIVNDGEFVELEKGLFLSFTMGAVIYSMWIVIVFIWEVNDHVYDSLEEEGGEEGRAKAKSVFRLGLDDDDDSEDDLFFEAKSKSRSSGRKKQRKEDKTPLIHKHKP